MDTITICAISGLSTPGNMLYDTYVIDRDMLYGHMFDAASQQAHILVRANYTLKVHPDELQRIIVAMGW